MSFYSLHIPSRSIGDGTYKLHEVDQNGRIVYINDKYTNSENPEYVSDSRGVGNMILSFDNILQEWRVSKYLRVKKN